MKNWLGTFFLFLLAVLAVGCAGATSSGGLEETISGLETQAAKNQELNYYQATQIGENRVLINQLSLRGPDGGPAINLLTTTPTPFGIGGLNGSVLIHDGSCCVGGIAGDTIQIDVQFEASSLNGSVQGMRVLTGSSPVAEDALEGIPWEPFVDEKDYPVTLATNWTTFWVHVQYRDNTGTISEIFSDDIAVEGMPAPPTDTPGG